MRFGVFALLVLPSCFSESASDSADSAPTSGATEATAGTVDPTLGGSGSAGEVSTDPTQTAEAGPGTASDSLPTMSDSMQSDSDPTSTDTDVCPPGTQMPVGPLAEWVGPYVLMPVDGPPCPEGLVADGPPIFSAPFVEGECRCSCNAACEAFTFDPGDNGCNDAGSPIEVPAAGCLSLEEVSRARKNGYAAPSDCNAPVGMPPAVSFGASHRVCAGADGQCIPVPDPSLGPCVRRAGAHPCEQQEFPHRIDTMEDVIVSCQGCPECSMAAELACGAAPLRLHAEADCADAGQPIGGNNCSGGTGVAVSMDIDLACPPTVVGAQNPIGPVTYCCAEPG